MPTINTQLFLGAGEFLCAAEDLVSVAKSADSNAQQIFVAHLHQDIHRDVLSLEEIGQTLKLDTGQQLLH